VVVIVMGIPMTSSVAVRLKTIQKVVSKLRDERVKLSNEVLAGMKVIKLQAWEEQYQARINVLRDKELAELKKYTVTQALSGTLFTVIPLLVTIVSFMAYIYLGNSLDVATALTSLALFDLLRFPLAMLPNVLNNLVEAKVSVDRVQVRVMYVCMRACGMACVWHLYSSVWMIFREPTSFPPSFAGLSPRA